MENDSNKNKEPIDGIEEGEIVDDEEEENEIGNFFHKKNINCKNLRGN